MTTTNDPNNIWGSRPNSHARNRAQPPTNAPEEVPIDSVAALEFISDLFERLIIMYQNTRGYGRVVGLLSGLRMDIADRKWNDLIYLQENNIDEFLQNLDRLMDDATHDQLMSAYLDIILPEAIEANERARTEAPTVVTSPEVDDSVAAMFALLEDSESLSTPTEVRLASTGTVFGMPRKRLFAIGGVILIATLVAILAYFLVSRRLQNNNNAAESVIEQNSIYLPSVLPTGTPSILPTLNPNPLSTPTTNSSAESILGFNETSVPQCVNPAMQIPWAVYKNVGTYIHPDTLPRNGCYNTAPLVNVIAALYPESRYGVTGSLGDVITRDGCIVAMWRYPAGYHVEIFNTYNGKTVTCTMIRDRGPDEYGIPPLADASIVIPEGIALQLNSPGDTIAHPTYTVNLKLGGIDP